MFVNIISFIFV